MKILWFLCESTEIPGETHLVMRQAVKTWRTHVVGPPELLKGRGNEGQLHSYCRLTMRFQGSWWGQLWQDFGFSVPRLCLALLIALSWSSPCPQRLRQDSISKLHKKQPLSSAVMQVIHEAEDLSISGFQARVFLEERTPCHCNATAEQPFLIPLPPVCFDLVAGTCWK